MTLQNKLTFVFVPLLCTALLAILFSGLLSPRNVEGSTITGQDYMATSTAGSSLYGAKTSAGLLKNGYGSVSSVVITGGNTAVFNLYNATTTNVNLRTGQVPTSSILIASFPASVAAGTYTFDAEFSAGLYLDVISGNLPTSTVTFR